MTRKSPLYIEDLTLHKRPFKTLWFSCLYIYVHLKHFLRVVLRKKHRASLVFFIAITCLASYLCWSELLWYGKWLGLGILSSIGFGTGLHTFILFLGPQIAKTTMTAFYCDTLLVPIGSETLVGNRMNCEIFKSSSYTLAGPSKVSVLTVFFKILSIAFAWGAGTAIGELPPYFLAKAGSGDMTKEEEESDDDGSNSSEPKNPSKRKIGTISYAMNRIKDLIGGFITRFRWKAILPLAAIPNPLFDLAGVTCGMVGISFWEFFLPTFLGKACIKAPLQSIFIVLLFSDDGFQTLIEILDRWEATKGIKTFILGKKELFSNPDPDSVQESIIGIVWDVIIKIALGYFAWHAVEHFAHAYAKSYAHWSHKPKKHQKIK